MRYLLAATLVLLSGTLVMSEPSKTEATRKETEKMEVFWFVIRADVVDDILAVEFQPSWTPVSGLSFELMPLGGALWAGKSVRTEAKDEQLRCKLLLWNDSKRITPKVITIESLVVNGVTTLVEPKNNEPAPFRVTRDEVWYLITAPSRENLAIKSVQCKSSWLMGSGPHVFDLADTGKDMFVGVGYALTSLENDDLVADITISYADDTSTELKNRRVQVLRRNVDR